jgi:hypothetical protein
MSTEGVPMSTYINLITYVIYLALIVWTLINYAMFVRNKAIDMIIICGILIFLFPAHPIIIPLGLMGNYVISLTSGLIVKSE